jgi:hypothetical protein
MVLRGQWRPPAYRKVAEPDVEKPRAIRRERVPRSFIDRAVIGRHTDGG